MKWTFRADSPETLRSSTRTVQFRSSRPERLARAIQSSGPQGPQAASRSTARVQAAGRGRPGVAGGDPRQE